jgi:hypothetical protein
VSQRRRGCHGPATSSRAGGSVCPGRFPGGPEAAVSRADDDEVEPTVQLLKAWLPVYHAVDSGEVALRLARALAASPESSAVWLPSADCRANYVASLAYRGHLREAAGAWRPDLLWSSTLLAELALFRRTRRTAWRRTSAGGSGPAISPEAGTDFAGGLNAANPAASRSRSRRVLARNVPIQR